MTTEPLLSNTSTATDETPAPDKGSGGQVERQLQAIQQYRDAAFAKQNPLAVTIASGSSDLMELGVHLKQALLRDFETASDVVEATKRWEPAMNVLLRMHRQIDRYAQLEHRMEARPVARNGQLR